MINNVTTQEITYLLVDSSYSSTVPEITKTSVKFHWQNSNVCLWIIELLRFLNIKQFPNIILLANQQLLIVETLHQSELSLYWNYQTINFYFYFSHISNIFQDMCYGVLYNSSKSEIWESSSNPSLFILHSLTGKYHWERYESIFSSHRYGMRNLVW